MRLPSRRTFLSAAAGATAAAAALRAAPLLAQAGPEIFKGAAVAMHGEPKYRPGFKHFEFVNPDAPKGGAIYHAVGDATFDSFNPFILKGSPPGLISSMVFDRLMVMAEDEPFSIYAHLAKTIEFPKDRAWVAFELDERARFHDGSPVTADDVVFSFATLVDKGRPVYAQYWRDVAKVEKTGPLGVRFVFKAPGNRELPMILTELPVLSKAFWATRNFDAVTLERPLGSGPYRIGDFSAGTFVTLERVKDYWAANLPAGLGFDNFDRIRLDFFRDTTVMREALKAGEFDYRDENQALAWATHYATEAVRSGLMIKREVKHNRPAGMQAIVLNTRRPVFRDWRVRRALAMLFDFEWTNKNIFFGQYVRSLSYFANSDMASSGLPQGEELKLLEPFRGRVPDTVFTEAYALPVFAGDGNIRDGMRNAIGLLRAAGWEAKDGKLVDKAGAQFRFELITDSPADERFILPFVQNLRRLGVDASLRVLDPVQYQKRSEAFDFDVLCSLVWGQSESPGNEQRNLWGSAAADLPGSENLIGIKDKAIDELIELVVAAPDREQLVLRCRALDRVLLHHHFVVPCWHLHMDRIAHWDKFGLPAPHARGTNWRYWWVDQGKAARLKGRIRSEA